MAEYGNVSRNCDEQRQIDGEGEEGDDYWRLSAAHMGGEQPYFEDSFDSWSGSYENPEALLERTPAQPYQNVDR